MDVPWYPAIRLRGICSCGSGRNRIDMAQHLTRQKSLLVDCWEPWKDQVAFTCWHSFRPRPYHTNTRPESVVKCSQLQQADSKTEWSSAWVACGSESDRRGWVIWYSTESRNDRDIGLFAPIAVQGLLIKQNEGMPRTGVRCVNFGCPLVVPSYRRPSPLRTNPR